MANQQHHAATILFLRKARLMEEYAWWVVNGGRKK
jgi:hypothetical protein